MSDGPRYVAGIDLGTTNSAIAYVSLHSDTPSVAVLPVPQLVAPGSIEPFTLLPSFLYVLTAEERASAAFHFRLSGATDIAVGEWARRRGAELPERLVASAKSWLCVDAVDREGAILPWDAAEDIAKLSPVAASAAYLRHLRSVWNQRFPDAPLEAQAVFLGVPASFDPVARGLTARAAALAGLERVTLIEEPQAAFYAWIERHAEQWRNLIAPGDLVVVCDVGGGTTDFTLIEVRDESGGLALERVAVGEHILLGGDNMDLALAHALRHELQQQGTVLDPWQFRALVLACRGAKEALLGEPERSPASAPISVLGRGRRLIGNTIRLELRRELVQQILLDGFFPYCPADATPASESASALAEWGLPYAADPGVTRHLAAFLRSARSTTGAALATPSAVLFHGGVLQATALRHRILDVFRHWSAGDTVPRELPGADFAHAVARGAAYYGYTRARGGVRIRGGVAHAYYLGIVAALPAVPGLEPPLKALCIVPRGLEEGNDVGLPQREFALTVGRTVEFRFFQSATRADSPGSVVEDVGPEFQELPPVSTRLEWEREHGRRVPVYVHARVDELGTLQLWFVHRDGSQRWKLEFDLRARERTPTG